MGYQYTRTNSFLGTLEMDENQEQQHRPVTVRQMPSHRGLPWLLGDEGRLEKPAFGLVSRSGRSGNGWEEQLLQWLVWGGKPIEAPSFSLRMDAAETSQSCSSYSWLVYLTLHLYPTCLDLLNSFYFYQRSLNRHLLNWMCRKRA